MSEEKLAKAEKAIEDLADALGMSEMEIVNILRDGMESLSPIAGQLKRTHRFFIEEMESTFGY